MLGEKRAQLVAAHSTLLCSRGIRQADLAWQHAACASPQLGDRGAKAPNTLQKP